MTVYNNRYKLYPIIFFTSFFLMIMLLLPNIILNHGVYLNIGDYFYQQIPFYCHASDVVRIFGIGWDWYTDLGSDFLSSYSFYLAGSPFFWLVSWVSSDIIIYIMPLMLAFKTAVGALGAFAYLKRYVKDDCAAFLGSLMYAFSGFQMVSLIFNHFHDITALFPFFLLSFDMLLIEKQKCFFAFMVFLTSVTNYFFFVEVIIFVIIYYCVKCITKDFVFTLKSLLSILLEAFIGVGGAAIILFPTFIVLKSANRVNDILYGVDLVSYNDSTIIPKIVQSLFLIPDPAGGGMLFKSNNKSNNWASISLYLPVFTITGVVTYLKNNKNTWLSLLLKICVVIALIPGLNSVFSLFNSTYYARWFFMPVLLMCLATAKAIEKNYSFIPGIKTCVVGLDALILIFCLPNKVIVSDSDKLSLQLGIKNTVEGTIKAFSMSPEPVIFWQSVIFSFVFLLVVFVYEVQKLKDLNILKKLIVVMSVVIVITGAIYINNGILTFEFEPTKRYSTVGVFSPEIQDDETYRMSDVSPFISEKNYSMKWRLMNIGCFHSIEANEVDEFYYQVQGKPRLMCSDYEASDYPVYGLLSVKYIFNESTGDDLNVECKPVELKGCSLYDKQGNFYIYKNDYFVPFGVIYDYCIDSETLEDYLNKNVDGRNRYQYKKLAMMRALVLDEKDIEKYKDYISIIPKSELEGLGEKSYYADCLKLSSDSCKLFNYDSKGYRAEITTENKGIVYFSVPCSDGWTAKVNGNDIDIIKAHYGLTAIPVEAGTSKIEFFYETPGLKEGKIISLISLLLGVGYFLAEFSRKKVQVLMEG